MWDYDNDTLKVTLTDVLIIVFTVVLVIGLVVILYIHYTPQTEEQELIPTTTIVVVECEPYSVKGTVIESTVLGDVRVCDTTGNEWLLTNECTLQCGDTVVLTLTDNGTPTDNTDDRVLTVYNTDTHKAITISKYNSQYSTPMEW